MAIGYYSNYFDSAISPWTTLGPLALVISISLLQEGMADLARHRSDIRTNSTPCIVLERADDDGGGGRTARQERNLKHKDERVINIRVDAMAKRRGSADDLESQPQLLAPIQVFLLLLKYLVVFALGRLLVSL